MGFSFGSIFHEIENGTNDTIGKINNGAGDVINKIDNGVNNTIGQINNTVNQLPPPPAIIPVIEKITIPKPIEIAKPITKEMRVFNNFNTNFGNDIKKNLHRTIDQLIIILIEL
jgi:hypothetical protein